MPQVAQQSTRDIDTDLVCVQNNACNSSLQTMLEVRTIHIKVWNSGLQLLKVYMKQLEESSSVQVTAMMFCHVQTHCLPAGDDGVQEL